MISSTEHYRRLARNLAPTFAERAPRWDQERIYCHENLSDLTGAGLMGMTLPRAYGGQGANFADTIVVVEEIAKACALSARILVESNMGGISAIMAYGTDAQKRYCAPLVLGGDKPAICITEPDAGSAATDMRTTAQRRGDRYVLNGAKHWITGGGVSKLYLIFARVLAGDGTDQGIGGFLVHVDPVAGLAPKGFRVAERERTMGLCGMPEARLEFTNLEVPDEMVLCPPSGFRRGFAELMTAYNSQRVGAGAVALGLASGALERATDYVKQREQFGRPLAEFQGLQWMLADMDTSVHAARLMLSDAAHSASTSGTGFPCKTAAARAKLFATETAIRVVDQALQLFGARGYSAREPLERMYRDVRMFTIGGGTAQILRTQVAGALLEMPTPQTRGGYQNRVAQNTVRTAAE